MLSGASSALIAERAAALAAKDAVEEVLKWVAVLIAGRNSTPTGSRAHSFWCRFGIDVDDARLQLFGHLAERVRELLRRRNLQLGCVGAVDCLRCSLNAALNDRTNKNADK